MGYYTDYYLNIVTDVDKATLLLIEKEVECMNVFSEGYDRSWCEYNVRWYDHDEDMAKLSLKFPNVVFELHGIGDNPEDMWYTYYKNGYAQYCPAEITYDSYDSKLLTPVKLDPNYEYSYA